MALGGMYWSRGMPIQIRRWTFGKRVVERMGDAIYYCRDTGGNSIQAAGQVVLRLEGVGQEVIVLRTIVRSYLRTGVLENESACLLEQVERPICGNQVVVMGTHEQPKPVIADGLAQFHPRSNRCCCFPGLPDAGLRASDYHQIDRAPGREVPVPLFEIIIGERHRAIV